MKHLVITTRADLSVEQFRPFADIMFLEEVHGSGFEPQDYETVYFRSHFSHPETLPQNFVAEIDNTAAQLAERNAYVIDHVKSVEEILAIEDKWNQYQLLGDDMPKTHLASEDELEGADLIFKKRLSSRASGIAWSKSEISGDLADWIVQPRLEILEELRIYVVHGMVCRTAAIRQSKTENKKVKVTELRSLSSEEIAFAKNICDKIPQLDFVGLDVVVTPQGLVLIEINRSPDFAAFTKISQINPAKSLYENSRMDRAS